MAKKIDYKSSGVHYDLLDPFKVAAQKAAASTDGNINYLKGFKEVPKSRGESAFLIETDSGYIAHVEETLGTKNLIADAMYKITGKSYYDSIAIDTVAAIVNDLITMGALPMTLAMHLAVGDSHWFEDQQRQNDLVMGWKKGCDLSSALWAGGETPTLQGILQKDAVLLSGSAVGIIQNKDSVIRSSDLQDEDRIILLESSGIHANGASLCRKIASEIPEGYQTKISDGRMFGEAVLDPTVIYVPVLKDCMLNNIKLHYVSHITGHGWRKIMRAVEPYSYIIQAIPEPPAVFGFLQEQSGLSDEEMYGTFNMGAGFALYVAPEDTKAVLDICVKNNIKGIDAGYVKTRGEEKKVSIVPKGIKFGSETLAVR
ncbi:phosphoribosylformylglycinamidine cyclo-ligase [Candidatus Peregrinibacteria bacterium]|nr:phosphoribosylformylglycinamidine cyclo-ligase [Candidatus Peregrinibacteria bacterium]